MKLIIKNQGIDVDLVSLRPKKEYVNGNTYVSMTWANCPITLEKVYGSLEQAILTGSWWDTTWTGASLEEASPVYLRHGIPTFDATSMVETKTGMEHKATDKPTKTLRVKTGPFDVASVVENFMFTKIYRLEPQNQISKELIDSLIEDKAITHGLMLLKGDNGSTSVRLKRNGYTNTCWLYISDTDVTLHVSTEVPDGLA